MNFVRLIPVFLSMVLLAAHSSRAGSFPLTIVALLTPLLLFVRRMWVARAFQIILVIGALEWVRSLVAIAARRMEMEAPWLRMALILFGVALFTGLSALAFQTKGLKARYSND